MSDKKVSVADATWGGSPARMDLTERVRDNATFFVTVAHTPSSIAQHAVVTPAALLTALAEFLGAEITVRKYESVRTLTNEEVYGG